jgi:hypothetical protein
MALINILDGMEGKSEELDSIKVALRIRNLNKREINAKREVIWGASEDRKEIQYLGRSDAKKSLPIIVCLFGRRLLVREDRRVEPHESRVDYLLANSLVNVSVRRLRRKNNVETIRVTYLEIYNENVFDLLADPKDMRKYLNG